MADYDHPAPPPSGRRPPDYEAERLPAARPVHYYSVRVELADAGMRLAFNLLESSVGDVLVKVGAFLDQSGVELATSPHQTALQVEVRRER